MLFESLKHIKIDVMPEATIECIGVYNAIEGAECSNELNVTGSYHNA